MAFPILFDIGLIVFLSAILAYVARILKQPLIIAYVISGVLIGPFVFGFITNLEEINLLAELGIVFLLFSVGLEIDFRRFKNVGFVALTGGAIQVLLSFTIGLVVSIGFGLGLVIGVYLGLLIAFSSTMIVTTLLVDKDELNTMHGRMMLGILLLQDIVAVVSIPMLSNMANIVSIELFGSIVMKGVGLFAIAIILNKFFFPRILDYAAKRHEILFLTAMANLFFFIGASYVLGFSLAIGGFIAGLSMANFPYNVEIAGEVHALRDFFSIIFFSTLGMQLNFMVIGTTLPLFIILLLIILFIKPIILGLIYLFTGYGGRTSTYIGLGLGQASEFMFIIAASQLLLGNISGDFYSLLIGVVVISIVITPYTMKLRGSVYKTLSKIKVRKIKHFIHPRSIHEIENPPGRELKNHIILFGAHRMGEKIAEHLKRGGENLVVVERDPEIVKMLGKKDIYCVYGDAENDEILKKVSLRNAKLIILTIPFTDAASFVIRNARRFNKDVKIFTRAHSEMDAEELYKAGADVVIVPEFVSAEKIIKKVDHFLR